MTGPKLLNKVMSDWFNKIDLDKLDLSSSKNCILGQLYGSFWKGFEKLGLNRNDYSLNELLNLGFIVTDGISTEDWRKEIRSLKNVKDCRCSKSES